MTTAQYILLLDPISHSPTYVMTRLLWFSFLFSSTTLAGQIVQVFGKLAGGFSSTGNFNVFVEGGIGNVVDFFFESATKQYRIISDESDGEENERQISVGPLIPINNEPFSSASDWKHRSADIIPNLDIIHLRVLGEYLVRFVLPAHTPSRPAYFTENASELEYLVSLCLSGEGWELGWIIPHVPHKLLHQLDMDVKEAIMNSLIIGENHKGGWVSQEDYNRIRPILEPTSTTQSLSQSFQSSISVTDEDDIEPLESKITRLAQSNSNSLSASLDQSPTRPRNVSTAPADMALRMASIQRIRAAIAQRKADAAQEAQNPLIADDDEQEDVDDEGAEEDMPTLIIPQPIEEVKVMTPRKEETAQKTLEMSTKSRRKRKEKAKRRIEELKHHQVPEVPEASPRAPRSKKHYRLSDMALLASLIQQY